MGGLCRLFHRDSLPGPSGTSEGWTGRLDRVAYTEHAVYGFRGAVRSIVYWLIPFGTHSWRFYKGMTVLVFAFHIGLLFTPIFLRAHNIILKERWGFSLWSLPEGVADILTIVVIVAGVFLLLRRIAFPEVRIITTAYDYLLLAIAVAPFVTGFMAYHQDPDYHFWLIAHILCGEIMLVAIPFTKLSHFVLFFLSRAQIGMDFGIKRGGMKSKGIGLVTFFNRHQTGLRIVRMPEGKLCNKQPVTTKEHAGCAPGGQERQTVLRRDETSGRGPRRCGPPSKNTLKSRTKTWLEICAHCGMCADSCFFYLANNKDPKQVPSYKIQSTLGEIVKRKGKVDNAFMHDGHGYGLVQMHLLQPMRHLTAPSASTWA